MTRAAGIIGLTVLGTFGALAFYSWADGRKTPQAAQAEAPECDSCGARKKDLSRLRETLSAPATKSD